eukprot:CAMPEP_0175100968 /NCGR_PEP_ID=MMETSP0086_2-20121207/7479_1 /TAXON_ID=136419 /ORGANISM="Unknown Unknown, Strain D1" /LENGTH=85 /DNA_ID=CAMNT_0016375333 /DNA_START=155 /DNA_END=409 /DNA_ORIENTATION=-
MNPPKSSESASLRHCSTSENVLDESVSPVTFCFLCCCFAALCFRYCFEESGVFLAADGFGEGAGSEDGKLDEAGVDDDDEDDDED